MNIFDRYLILKENSNSFEKYYFDQLNKAGIKTEFYYINSSKTRKAFTHYGLPFDNFWYGNWKKHLDQYDTIIVFDSLHTSKLLKYIKSHSGARLIYWHWNPMVKKKDIKIWNETKELCEHWTFNPADAEKYGMKINNQFFFFQKDIDCEKADSVYFVGTDKGRYSDLEMIAKLIRENGLKPDFHVVERQKKGEFYQREFVDYFNVLDAIRRSKIAVELNQSGQVGLTSRALEAMFLGTKLITNNKNIQNCDFYNCNNIFILDYDSNEEFGNFLRSSFVKLGREKLYPYCANGWMSKFNSIS